MANIKFYARCILRRIRYAFIRLEHGKYWHLFTDFPEEPGTLVNQVIPRSKNAGNDTL